MIPQGYKHTEIGIIPREWDLKTMKDISWVNQGLQIPISNRFKNPSEKSKVYITIQYLNDGKELEYINDYSSSVVCTKEDVLMTRTGNTGIVVYDVEGVFHNNFFKINYNKKQVDRSYLIYFLKDTKTQKTILEKAGISTIPDLNHNDFYSIQIPIPPLPEQQAIAQALSDADELISSLEKLIAKKRLIKQGAMQELLTPKPNWVAKKLGDLLKYEQPTKYIVKSTEYTENGSYPVLTAGKSLLLGYTEEDFGVFKNLPVIIFDDFTTATKFINYPFKVKSSAMKMLLPRNSNVNLKLVFEIMQGIDFPLSDHKRYWISEYQNIEINLPTESEQVHIATILSDMDKEIENLNQKLEKYKSIKQGMMQDLLTGKVRLV
ncbi:MAG: restriction endonuclease subunit S [Bacteroidetes bacterium]|nr:restriction endonuclease subunit S [Bacteroidota bacterium]